MALPSQTERQTEIGRSYVYSQRSATANSARTVLLVAAGLAVAAGSIWGVAAIVNRRSATSTLPSTDGKAEVARSAAPVKPAPAPVHTPTSISLASTTPADSTQPKLSPAGGSNPTSLRTDAAIMPPTGSATTTTPSVPPTGQSGTQAPSPTSTPTSDPSGRPGAVDVTRKDLTPGTNAPATSPSSASPTSPTGPATGGQPASLTPTGSTSEVTQQIQAAEQRAAAGELLQARALFNKALHNPNAVRDDQERIRQKMAALNADLLFSPKVFAGDPMAETYVVKSGDNLIKIARSRELAVDWRLIERINGVKGNTLKVGQKLKLVRGPFHAIVHKGDYRLDLFQGSPDDPESWMFIRSFKVGLGTGNSTPLGSFVVKPKSKLVNPHWVNPQTGQKFHADDPKNPIGEYWMGIEGIGDSKTITGYGLHGTVEPDSIGQQKSMGCVRLGDEDIKLLYEMLVEQISDVKIVP